jgi:hypothetical protein
MLYARRNDAKVVAVHQAHQVQHAVVIALLSGA